MDVFCSTIIPTINRPTLSRAVYSVLDQVVTSTDFEVIVVNDSGQPLPDMDWQQSDRVKVIDTNRLERSIARNTGAAIAKGKYLHFLDDDDYLLPGGFNELFEVAKSSNTVWIYGAMQCLDNQGNKIFDNQPQVKGNLFSHFVVGETLSLIPSLINREAFFRVGGFDPNILPSEDRDLAVRLAMIGDFKFSLQFVASARIGNNGSSTDYKKMKNASRQVREKALGLPGALARLRDSVKDDVKLRGRGCRAYFLSSILNLSNGHIGLAIERFLSFSMLATYYLYHPDFWRGIFYNLEKRSLINS